MQLDWNNIRIFLALYDGKSVRAAASELKMSHSTVARHLTSLETSLGLVLFTRSKDGLKPTQSAERILERARAIERSTIELQMEAESLDSALSGTIRLTAPPLLSQKMIMPFIAEFIEKYPSIEVEIKSSYGIDDLMRGAADIAIRSQFEPDENLVGRRLPDFAECAYASKDYVKSHWFEADQTNGVWIGRGGDSNHVWVKDTPYPKAKVQHNMNDILDLAEAAKSGLGMVLLPCFYGDQIEGLARLPNAAPMMHRPVWVLTHPDLKSSDRVKTFAKFITEAMKKQKHLILGDLQHDGE